MLHRHRRTHVLWGFRPRDGLRAYGPQEVGDSLHKVVAERSKLIAGHIERSDAGSEFFDPRGYTLNISSITMSRHCIFPRLAMK